MKHTRTILVIGATGNQGGAVARQLLAAGWQVRALSRRPEQPAAVALAARGVEVVRGDLNEPASLRAAMAGVYGAFSVQTMMEHGVAVEEQQGKAVADAAAATEVQHLVYSSVGGAERGTGIPHFESKWAVEQHIRALGLPATILRPTLFMEMFRQATFRTVMVSLLASLVRTNKPVQLISVDDIGAFARLAFDQPDQFRGQALEIAGDSLTPRAIRTAFWRERRTWVPYLRVPAVLLGGLPPELGQMLRWFDRAGYAADLPHLRGLHPQLRSFAAWLRTW